MTRRKRRATQEADDDEEEEEYESNSTSLTPSSSPWRAGDDNTTQLPTSFAPTKTPTLNETESTVVYKSGEWFGEFIVAVLFIIILFVIFRIVKQRIVARREQQEQEGIQFGYVAESSRH